MVLALLAAPIESARAQDSTSVTGNLWLDFIINWRFTPHLRFFADNYYRTVVTGAPDQRMIGTRPELAWSALGWMQVMAGANIRYTDASDGLNSWELRPYVGVQFIADRFEKFVLMNYTRLEYRKFLYTGSDSTSSSWRLRSRFEAAVLIRGERFGDAGSWDIIGDAEFFLDLTEAVDERFADRLRFRFGVGHVRTRNWHFDGFYVLQFSRDTQTSGVTSIDNYIRLRVKWFPTYRLLDRFR